MTDRLYLGGVTDTVIHTETDGTVIVEERQDCEDILAHNARSRNHRFSSMSPEGGFQEAYNIPMTFVLKWQRECGAAMLSDEHMAYMDRMIRSPEFKGFNAAPTVRDPRIIIRGAR